MDKALVGNFGENYQQVHAQKNKKFLVLNPDFYRIDPCTVVVRHPTVTEGWIHYKKKIGHKHYNYSIW